MNCAGKTLYVLLTTQAKLSSSTTITTFIEVGASKEHTRHDV